MNSNSTNIVINPHHLSSKTIVKLLESNINLGLTKPQIKARIKQFGKNELPYVKPKTIQQIILDQFLNSIIYILIIAAILAFYFTDWLEGTAIVLVILITVIIGFFMELKAIQSLEVLRKMGQSLTNTLRNGEINLLKSSALVPGDIIILEVGDVVTADARIIHSENLTLKESILTGESFEIEKHPNKLPLKTPINQQKNMVFKATIVTRGMGKAIVIGTGLNTELGKIQQLGVTSEKKQTPLEKKLNKLSHKLIFLTLFLTTLIIIAGYFRGQDLVPLLQTGIALAVASIPEGLPIVATIALAQGMLKLLKKQVVIKKLEAVQTLGATTIICTDKTGTLTEDQMKVYAIDFESESYSKLMEQSSDLFKSLKKNKSFNCMIMVAVLCNDSILTTKKRKGDAMDLALTNFAEQVGYNAITLKANHPEKIEIAFDTERKMMATVNQHNGSYTIYAKGAFESIAKCCDTILVNNKTQLFSNKEEWHNKINKQALQGLRILAFAYKNLEELPNNDSFLHGLTFIGIISFIDPAREDVKAIISTYKKAGIRVVMMTGDHPGTATKIAQEIGLLNLNTPNKSVFLGSQISELNNLSKIEKDILLNASIFARVTPKQKLDIITLFQQNNEIVGMIGDGVNDVPALKKADIGISMGIRGTEAARASADVILKDDKFSAIALGIKQGRAIFENIRQFVVYLLSSNLAEIISVGLAALLNLPSPLLPLQILFLNLITDIFPAMALGLGKGASDTMSKPPRNPNEPIMTSKLWNATIIYGLCITASVLGITIYSNYVLQLASSEINNLAFFTLIFAQLLNVFNLPKRQLSFFKNEVTTNKWIWIAILFCLALTFLAYSVSPIAKVLSIQALAMYDLTLIIIFGFGSLVLAQLIKRIGGTI